MTPTDVAFFLVDLMPEQDDTDITLLDPGAGQGALTTAFIKKWTSQRPRRHLAVDAVEIDKRQHGMLVKNLSSLPQDQLLTLGTRREDFILSALKSDKKYSHIILNPPYARIDSKSPQAKLLRQQGLPSTNLYSAFLSISIKSLAANGSLVALVPRSFCNGKYYKPLRDLILHETSIHHIHLFESRTDTFKSDGVIQENIAIVLRKRTQAQNVSLSTSKAKNLSLSSLTVRPFQEIVRKGDDMRVIRLPLHQDCETSRLEPLIVKHRLSDLGLSASTGPIVDFRNRRQLRLTPTQASVPLIHSYHIQSHNLCWPLITNGKKNALVLTNKNAKNVLKPGYYIAIRRFSSKEQYHRIVANPVEAIGPPFLNGVSFENHVNYITTALTEMDRELCWGLTAYLNTDHADRAFRDISGSTQVNVSDLKILDFPPLEDLRRFGIELLKLGSVSPVNSELAVKNVLSTIHGHPIN